MQRFKIIGTGSDVPDNVVTNDDLAKTVDTSDSWIRERTGIGARRFAPADAATSDLAAGAVRRACEDAGLDPAELDAIIVGTCSQDTIFPSTACWVQEKLGVRGMPAFDVMAGCTSWLYGLKVAADMIAGNPSMKIAVCGAEMFSKILDFDDRRTCVLFGDGAGATVITGADTDTGLLASNWGSDGTLASILKIAAGGTAKPASHATVDGREHFVYMEGSKVFKHAVTAMSSGMLQALSDAEMTPDDIDVFIPHQANKRIMDACLDRTRIDGDRVFSVLEKYGNISAASIPVAMDEARKAGVLCEGHTLAVTAFGTGLTWAAGVLRM
ncbi:MAG: 3-oxoacyl-ACP synthase III family protein [Nannocystaceae bacterium]|nr:ketoacyl-ACP synthase III [bacterium]